MTAKVGSLNVDLTLETARFNKGLRGAQQELTIFQKGAAKLGGAIAGAFAISTISDAAIAFRTMTREATNTVGALGEQAAQLGVNTTALQEYRYAASQAGIEQSEMDTALSQLTRRLGEAAGGAKAPAEALAKLGISLRDSEGNVRTASQTIPLIADALRTIPSEAEKAAILVDLFGRSGQKLLPLLNEGAQGIKSLTDAAREMGLVLTEEEIANADKYADAMDALDKKVQAQLAAKLAKNAEGLYKFELALAETKIALIDGVGAFNNWVNAVKDGTWQQRANAVLQLWNTAWQGVPMKIATVVAGVVQSINRMVSQVSSAITGRLSKIWDGAIAKIQRVKQAFFDMWDKVTRRSYVPDMVDDIAREMKRLDTVMVNPALAATDKVTEAMREMQTRVRSLLDKLFPEVRKLLDYQQDLRDIDAGVPEGQRDEAKRRLALDSFGIDPTSDVPLSDEVMNQGPLVDIDIDAVNRGLQESLGLTDKLKDGWMSLKEAGGYAFGELTHQLKGVLLGAQSLGDAIRNLVAQLADMALSMAFKALGASIGLPIPGFANGTNFAPGGLSLVGERGPELVNLPRGSQVIPNRDLRGLAANSNTTVNLSMVASGNPRADRESAAQAGRAIRRELNGLAA